MDVLWAPWRMHYILGPKPDECVFCIPNNTEDDERRKILFRGQTAFVVMNIFPYNNGHMMVAPYRHVPCVTDLTLDEASEVMALTSRCVGVLKESMRPQGVNAGFNLGEAAGAGIAAHLHFQIVPRWNGDASFMAVLGDTRVIPEHLEATYQRLKPYFSS